MGIIASFRSTLLSETINLLNKVPSNKHPPFRIADYLDSPPPLSSSVLLLSFLNSWMTVCTKPRGSAFTKDGAKMKEHQQRTANASGLTPFSIRLTHRLSVLLSSCVFCIPKATSILCPINPLERLETYQDGGDFRKDVDDLTGCCAFFIDGGGHYMDSGGVVEA